MKILYVNENSLYINEDGRIIKKNISYEKGIVTANIGYRDIYNITFKLPKSIDKDMLEIEAEKYVFNEGSIDFSKDYKINYFFNEFEEFYNVEAFIVESSLLKNKFAKTVSVFRYIDFISAAPLVFKEYYNITNTQPKNDAFIYLSKDEAFLSFFKNGEFIYVKSINKISNLAKQLNMPFEDLTDILKHKGLDKDKYDNEDLYFSIDAFFSKFFMKVSNILNYSVNYYSLNKIDRIYFYSGMEINGLINTYQEFWKSSAIEFKQYKINTDYDYFDYTAAVYNSRHYNNENENFTVFPKPVPFYKKETGKLGMLLLCGFVLICADAFYKYNILQKQSYKILQLDKLNIKIKKEKKFLNLIINKYENDINHIKTENIDIKNKISDISNMVNNLYTLQKSPLASNQIADITSLLNKYNLKLSSFDKEGNHTTLFIISSFDNSSDVARFMKNLLKMGYKNVNSKQISNTDSVYISEVDYDE